MNHEEKLLISKMRIQQWYEHWDGDVFIAFSGGKDSTALLHLVRSLYPDVLAVFSNTGLEYPEIVKFAESFDNVQTIRPKKSFVRVLKEDGFPISNKKAAGYLQRLNNPNKNNFRTRRLGLTGYVTKDGSFSPVSKLSGKWVRFLGADINVTNKCCDYLKKDPVKYFAQDRKKAGLPKLYPMTGMMMGEGHTRDMSLSKRPCNVTDSKDPTSSPLKFWDDDDVWKYIKDNNIEVCSVYKDYNLNRTGCTFCAYGAELEKGENRFEKLLKSHPKQHNSFINKFGMSKALDYAGIRYGQEPEHKALEMPTYKCCSCGEDHPLNKVAYAEERDWTQMEELTKPFDAGMKLYCRDCAIKNSLPYDKK